ncbi:Nn.00g087470.m01.CDS01 [Neocucurbitaria sp. VM-36]
MSIPESKSIAFASSSPSVVPEPSTEEQKPKTERSSVIIPTSVPQPSFVPVSVAPPISTGGDSTATSRSPPHIALASWTGTDALLRGYCATPDYTIIDGPTAYWAPVLGCVGDKPDCCPFDIPPSTLAIEAAAVETGSTSAPAAITTGSGSSRGFPSALSPVQATFSSCTDDYVSIAEGCCPSYVSMRKPSTAFGGQTPCYSTLLSATTPPPISANVASYSTKPTSAIVNVVYAMQYPLHPSPSKSGLSTGAKIGIGAGAAIITIVFGVLIPGGDERYRQHAPKRVAASSAFGGVKDWRKNISSDVVSGLEPIQEPTLPQVNLPAQAQYPSDWRPDQRTVSPPVPNPGYYSRSSLPSPPIPGGYSEVGSENGYSGAYSKGSGTTVYGGGNPSELQSGNYGMQRQELQGDMECILMRRLHIKSRTMRHPLAE